MGCFTEMELSATLLFSGKAENVVEGLLVCEDVDVALIGRVGTATEVGPDLAIYFRSLDIPSVGVSMQLTGTTLCPTDGINSGAETGEGGTACGAITNSGGSAGWADP